MKNTFIISLLIAMMGMIVFNGCQKHSSCECEDMKVGYLTSEGSNISMPEEESMQTININATFIEDLTSERYAITGHVPSKYIDDEMNRKVKICLKRMKYRKVKHYQGFAIAGIKFYKISCIEDF